MTTQCHTCGQALQDPEHHTPLGQPLCPNCYHRATGIRTTTTRTDTDTATLTDPGTRTATDTITDADRYMWVGR